MTKCDVYQVVAQAGKIIRKELKRTDFWMADSAAEHFVLVQQRKLAQSESMPRSIMSLDYYEPKEANVVFDKKTGKKIEGEDVKSELEQDAGPEVKVPKKRPARPSDKKKEE